MRPLQKGMLRSLSGAIGRYAMVDRVTLRPSAFRRRDVSRDLMRSPRRDSRRSYRSWIHSGPAAYGVAL
jgi:hypothetical protein